LLLISQQINAQDTIQIKEVIKSETRFSQYSNLKTEIIDSTLKSYYKNASLDELLFKQTPSFIKSYGGLGNLSTIVLRGSNSNHVSVNWNGFPINSISTGGTDLSLIQSGFFNNITVIPGASSSLYGSGTFGGAIELNNLYNQPKGFDIRLEIEPGSFHTVKNSIETNYSGNSIQYRIAIDKIFAENDFVFLDNFKINPVPERRKNNALNSFNIFQTLKLNLPKSNTIEAGIWYILKYKEIPEIAGSYETGNKNQTDSIFRAFFRWKKLNKHSIFSLSTAFFTEYLHYTDKLNIADLNYFIDSEINSLSVFSDLSYRYYFNKKLTIEFAGLFNRQKIQTSNYINDHIADNNYSLLMAAQYKLLKSEINFSFRNEFSLELGFIPVFNAGLTKKILNEKLTLKSSISNKFRRPTFNERYWLPGGNSKLKHERGISVDINPEYVLKKEPNQLIKVSATTYYSKIYDMIQWIPDTNQVWTAVNNNEVNIIGLESDFNLIFKKNNFVYSFNTSYNYTYSVQTNVFRHSNFEFPAKLIYTPEHSAKLFFSTTYKKINIGLSTQYIGKMFTTQDNNLLYVLSPFVITDLYSAYHFKIKNYLIDINAKIINMFNSRYQLIKSYPSPGRAIYVSIRLTYKKE
jgi:outer membrane cobalamin receptor